MQSSASDITPDNIAKTARIKKIQQISLLLLFLAGIINFLDRGSLSVANEAIRADLGFQQLNLVFCYPLFHYLTVSHSFLLVYYSIGLAHVLC